MFAMLWPPWIVAPRPAAKRGGRQMAGLADRRPREPARPKAPPPSPPIKEAMAYGRKKTAKWGRCVRLGSYGLLNPVAFVFATKQLCSIIGLCASVIIAVPPIHGFQQCDLESSFPPPPKSNVWYGHQQQ